LSEQAPFYLFVTFVLTYGTQHLDPVAAAILAGTGSSFWISVYTIGCCVLSMIALVLVPRPAPDRVPTHAEH
jgi:hypothetical protein